MPETSQKQLGELAIQSGMISPEQLREALQEFSVRKAAGSRLPLGEVLIELEFITREQLEKLLTSQGGKKAPRQQIPGFELVRKLGEGGMGATYLARQVSMDRLVALKVLRKKLSEKGDFIERFKREARLAGQLNHRNIVQAMDVGESSGFHYLIMEYVEGRNLVDLMPQDEAMDETGAVDYVLQIASALAFANEQNIIHRDIKPDNIMVTGDGVAKLCDFGLAKQTAEDSSLTQTGVAMGTPHYISPEQARGKTDIDIRGDIYSLGGTLYHLVTGQTPYSGPTAAVVMTKHLNEQLPWPQDVNQNVSDGCARVITKMMAKDPKDRYQSPEDLVSDLESVKAGRPPQLASVAKGRSSVAKRGAMQVKPRPGRKSQKRYRTTQMKSASRTSVTEALLPDQHGESPSKLVYAIGAAVLLVIGLGTWGLISSLGGDDPPSPPPGKVVDVEAEASAFWSSDVQPQVKAKLNPDDARGLLAALTHFSGSHGKTEFAAGKKNEIEKLQALANKAINEPDKAAEDMFKYAQEFWEKNPKSYDGALSKFKTVLEASKGSLTAMKAADAIKEVEAARTSAVDAALAALMKKAAPLVEGGNFDAALDVLRAPPGTLEVLLTPGVKNERTRIHALARSRIKPALERALGLSKDGKPREGLAALEKINALRYAPWKDRMAALRSRLEKEKLDVAALELKRARAAARKRLDELLDESDELLAKGRAADAIKRLQSGKKKLTAEQLKGVARELGAAEKVVQSLVARKTSRQAAIDRLVGTRTDLRTRTRRYRKCKITKVHADGLSVEYQQRIMGTTSVVGLKLKFNDFAPGEMDRLLPPSKPGTPDEQVAAAILAMHARRFSEAETWLKSAGAQPLVGRYRRKMDILKLGAVEAAAKTYWDGEVQPKARPKYVSLPAAKAMIAALDDFAAKHGKTAFGRGRKAEAARLRSLAETRIEASPEGLTHTIRKIFGGKVQAFSPRTMEIDLLYDFEDEKQLRDWWNAKPGKRGGSNTLLHDPRGKWTAGYLQLKAAITVKSVDLEAECEEGAPGLLLWAQCRMLQSWFPRGFRLLLNAKYAETHDDLNKNRQQNARCGFKTDVGIRHKLRILFKGGKSHVLVDGKEILSSGYVQGGYCFGLGGGRSSAKLHADNIRIVGTLHKPWIESVTRLFDKPNPWQAVWKQRKAARPLLGHGTTIFDTTRNRMVAVDSEYTVQAYDYKQDKWHVLHQSLRGKPTGSMPKEMHCLNAVYDAGADRMLVGGLGPQLAFDMKANRWSVLKDTKEAAHPMLASGGGLCLLVTGGNRGESFMKVIKSGAPEWQDKKGSSNSPWSRQFAGDMLTYDSKRKEFFMFSGIHTMNDTLTYNPRKNSWTRLWPAFSPPAGRRQSLCYDAGNDLVVMHGGRGRSLRTWVFDRGRNSWFMLNTPKPEGRPHGSKFIEYDPINKCCIAWESGRTSRGVSLLRLKPANR